jgi:hypothetical protein
MDVEGIGRGLFKAVVLTFERRAEEVHGIHQTE